MTHVDIYGPTISTFVRVVAMTAVEKGLAFQIIPTDPKAPEHRARHPFERAPAVRVDGVALYETDAICRYLDEAYAGPALQPDTPLLRARMVQWMSAVQHYIFPTTEYGLVMPRVVAPMMGRVGDEALIARALPTIRYQLDLVEAGLSEAPFIAGERLSLADLYLFCVWMAVAQAPEGRAMLADMPLTSRWLDVLAARPSAVATRWPGEPG